MPPADWHERYQEQAQWTNSLRHYILSKLPIQFDWTVCELGCGTGAVLPDFIGLSDHAIGLDHDLNALAFQNKGRASLVCADASMPPFQEKTFDLIFCHYFLLWISDPIALLSVARNFLKPGAYLALFAEPDYASRRTLPEILKPLAKLQNRSLGLQGVNLEIGRNLGNLLKTSGFSLIEFGSMKESGESPQFLTETEKNVLRADWEFLNHRQETAITLEALESLLEIVPERWYVPTYYALAKLNK